MVYVSLLNIGFFLEKRGYILMLEQKLVFGIVVVFFSEWFFGSKFVSGYQVFYIFSIDFYDWFI